MGLTHFMPLVSFYTSWKHQKTTGKSIKCFRKRCGRNVMGKVKSFLLFTQNIFLRIYGVILKVVINWTRLTIINLALASLKHITNFSYWFLSPYCGSIELYKKLKRLVISFSILSYFWTKGQPIVLHKIYIKLLKFSVIKVFHREWK